jgi:hypothetical protein
LKKGNLENKRLKILTQNEIDNMYSRPSFNDDERLLYFSLLPKEEEVLNSLRAIKTKAVFILQLGYFKAKQLFFNFSLADIEVKEDLKYILNRYFGNIELFNNSQINKNTWSKHQNIILELSNYHTCTKAIRSQIEVKATSLAVLSSKPIYVFREIINYLEEQKVVVPGYSSLQKLIGKVLTNERERLCNVLQEYLTQDSISQLNRLLENSSGLYVITEIKHEPKDFKYGELKIEIQRGTQIYSLYLVSKTILSKLNISNESIKYHASLVNYYSVYKLKRLDKWVII